MKNTILSMMSAAALAVSAFGQTPAPAPAAKAPVEKAKKVRKHAAKQAAKPNAGSKTTAPAATPAPVK